MTEEFELAFPCEYPVRVIGRDFNDFEDFVREVVTRHVSDMQRADFSTRASSGEKYISVAFKFNAESREQVDALYNDLGKDWRVKVVL